MNNIRRAFTGSVLFAICALLAGCIETRDEVFSLSSGGVSPLPLGFYRCLNYGDDRTKPPSTSRLRLVLIRGQDEKKPVYLWIDGEANAEETNHQFTPWTFHRVNDTMYLMVNAKNGEPGEFIFPISTKAASFEYIIHKNERAQQVAKSFKNVTITPDKYGYGMKGPVKDQEAFVRALASNAADSVVKTHCDYMPPKTASD